MRMSKKKRKHPREMTTDEAVRSLFSGKALKHARTEVTAKEAKKITTKKAV
jgi:hypothetical protein